MTSASIRHRAGAFDVVHARLLLTHVPNRIDALASMVRVLRPGGWLVIEDADPALQPLICPDECGPAQQLANQLRQGFRRLMADRGADLAFGRTLPRLLREAGLTTVQADAFFPITSRHAPCWKSLQCNRSGSGSLPRGWPPKPRFSST